MTCVTYSADRVETGLGGKAGEPGRQKCPTRSLCAIQTTLPKPPVLITNLVDHANSPGKNRARRCRSGRHGGHQLGEPNNIQHPPQIIGERGQAELTADLFQATHQKRALVHPLLDAAEWMFDRLATPVEDTGALGQAFLHPIQHRFVLQTRDRAKLAAGAL